MHEALTRQGGTSGSMSSRGAGEKKLELDRRRIEHRISELNNQREGSPAKEKAAFRNSAGGIGGIYQCGEVYDLEPDA